MEWKEFHEIYAAHFKPLTSNEGLPVWLEFVEKSDSMLLKKALENLSDEYAYRKKTSSAVSCPKLSELKAEYFSLLREKKQNAELDQRGGSFCGHCHGSGMAFAVRDFDTKKWIDVRTVVPLRQANVIMIPCCCFKGQSQLESGRLPPRYVFFFGETSSVASMAATDFARACMKLYDDSRPKAAVPVPVKKVHNVFASGMQMPSGSFQEAKAV